MSTNASFACAICGRETVPGGPCDCTAAAGPDDGEEYLEARACAADARAEAESEACTAYCENGEHVYDPAGGPCDCKPGDGQRRQDRRFAEAHAPGDVEFFRGAFARERPDIYPLAADDDDATLAAEAIYRARTYGRGSGGAAAYAEEYRRAQGRDADAQARAGQAVLAKWPQRRRL